MARALINVPAKAKRGEIIAIKTLISHVMETRLSLLPTPASAFRATSSRRSSPPTTARRFSAPSCYPAIAANPFITFHTVATESGTIEFKWTGDNGYSATEQVKITVE